MTFECRFQRRYPVAVATLSGALDPVTASDAVNTLQGCVTEEQPMELILEVADLTVASRSALLPLLQFAREVRRWPATTVAVSGAAPELGSMITEAAEDGGVGLYPSVAHALAAGDARQVPPRVSAELQPTDQAPAVGRELIAQACRGWGVTRLQALAQLLGSELITNAVVHARTPMQVTVRYAEPVLQVSVRDGDPRLVERPPTGPQALPLADLGRGMLLLETLADDWGCVPAGDGKVVWACVAPPPPQSRGGLADRPQ
jgi:anti-sigma regulatory factor (Ser/Thr protein kinase)